MNVGALIPARISSKRLPQKNIRMLGSKPLVCWTLDTLLEADVFQDITVSTDSQEVSRLIQDLYPSSVVNVSLRPDVLCRYETSLDDIIANYLAENLNIDIVGVFMPTYPFRNSGKIREIDCHLRSRYPWRAISLTDSVYCTADFYMPKDDIGIKKIFDSRPLFCNLYQGTYSYWHRYCFGNVWQHYSHTMNERVYYTYVDHLESIDIDTEEDFFIAEQIASGKKMQFLPVQEYKWNEWSIITPQGVNVQALIDWIGKEKFQNMDHPLIAVEETNHIFARFLKLSEIVGRSHFNNLEAYKHVHAPQGIIAHQSQTFPKEYRSTPFYRFLRLRSNEIDFSTTKYYPDHHGPDFGTGFGEFDSTDYKIHETGSMWAPDILPWHRVIMLDELSKQPFYINPVTFSD